MKRQSITKKLIRLGRTALVAFAFFSLGCGGTAFNGNQNTGLTDQPTGPGDLIPFPSPGGSNGGSQPNGTFPIFSFQIDGIGYNAETFTVQTRDILRLRFKPGQQNSFGSTQGYAAIYSLLAVFIKVGDLEIATPLLNNGLESSVQTSNIMSFSTAFDQTCDPTDLACRQTVTVTVGRPNYDHFCYKFFLCTPTVHRQVYYSHGWNGEVQVETNDTEAF